MRIYKIPASGKAQYKDIEQTEAASFDEIGGRAFRLDLLGGVVAMYHRGTVFGYNLPINRLASKIAGMSIYGDAYLCGMQEKVIREPTDIDFDADVRGWMSIVEGWSRK